MKEHLSRFLSTLADALFPLECLDCGEEGNWLCAACLKKIKINQRDYCFNCKKDSPLGRACSLCAPNFFMDGCLTAASYDDPDMKRLVKTFKYGLASGVGEVLAGIIFSKISEKIADKDDFLKQAIVVPIPLHKKRFNWRGFNQSEILAREISNRLRLDLSLDLKRIKHRPPQAALSEEERKTNLIGCFRWEGESLRGKTVLLIDDVITTGSTLNEAAQALKEAGAAAVWGAVAAGGG